MKKIVLSFLLVVALVAVPKFIFAQSDCDIVFDFETASTTPPSTAYTAVKSDGSNAGSAGSTTIIEISDTGNHVLKTNSSGGNGNGYLRFTITLPTEKTLNDYESDLEIKLFFPQDGDQTHKTIECYLNDVKISDFLSTTSGVAGNIGVWVSKTISLSELASTLSSFTIRIGGTNWNQNAQFYIDDIILRSIPSSCITVDLEEDATLSDLKISGTTISEFNKNTTDYTIEVANDIESIDISATATQEEAVVSGDTGTKMLDVGANMFTITVTAPDKITILNYTIVIIRKDIGCNIIFDFEKDEINSIPSYDCSRIKSITIEDNPSKSAVNASNNSLKFIVASYGDDTFITFPIQLPEGKTSLLSDYQIIKFDLYASENRYNKNIIIGGNAGLSVATGATINQGWTNYTYEITSNLLNTIGDVNIGRFFTLKVGVKDNTDAIYYIDNITLVAKEGTCSTTYTWTPGASSSTDWEEPTNWTPNGTPGSIDNVLIPKSSSYPLLTVADTEIETITFKPGAELGGQNNLAYTSAIIQYNLKPGRWHMLSMPFQTTAQSFYLKDLVDGREAWLQKFKSESKVDAGWSYYPNLEQNMPIGEGFAYWIEQFDESDIDDVSFQIEKTFAASPLAGISPTVTLDFGEDDNYGSGSYFALVGNPFMTSIDFDALYNANNDKILSNYQVWTGSGFTGYNKSGTFGQITVASGLNKYIAPLQAFFVERNGTATGSLSFNLSTMQATGLSAGLRTATNPENKLDITASNKTASVLTFIANRTDGQSARKLMNGFTDIPDVYTLADDATTALGANIINTDYITIPIGLATSYKGDMSLTFSGMDSYNATIKFVDVDEKEEIDLTGENSYQYDFYYTPTNANNDTIANESRFYIALTPLVITDVDAISEESTLIYAKDKAIYAISSSGNLIQQVIVFDAQGRNLYNGANLNVPAFSVNTLQFGATDIYIVKVITEKGVKTVKVAP